MQIFTFEISNDSFGIPIEDVAFVGSKWETVSGSSSMSGHIKEIVLLHGITVPIYDLALQFGYVEQPMEYVVALNVKGVLLGLPVSGASSIITVNEALFYPVPAVLNTTQCYVKSVILYQEKLISLIDINCLIPPDVG